MSLSKFDSAFISGLVSVVPENHICIDDEIEFYGGNAAKLQRNKRFLGLGTRHVVPEGMTVCTMCEQAARLLIDQNKIDPMEIDTLIVSSINHDYNGNSSACILQGNLELSDEVACFDTSGLGCTDVVYGLWLAHALVQSGASKKCLFLEGSTSSLLVDKRNRHSSMLFGDAAAAVLVEKSSTPALSFFHLRSIGKDWKKIVTPAGGFKFPIRKDIIDTEFTDAEGNVIHFWDSIMRGGDIFKFAMEQAPETIKKTLDFAGMTHDEIDFFCIHQANGQIVRTIMNHAAIPNEKGSAETFTKYGNCGGTSVLVNYCDQLKKISPRYVQLVTFGVGLSVGSCILDTSRTSNGGVHLLSASPDFQTRENLIATWKSHILS